MRIAVISDIHGNAVALESVLSDLQRDPVDRVVCLGDAIQGGPQPAEVVAQLRALACPVVMGNADAWLLSGIESGNEPVSAEQEAVRQWSLSRLSEDDRAFITSFTPTVTVSLPGGRSLLAFHGSPVSFDDILLPETPQEEFARIYGPFAPAILTGGHTHLQHLRRLGETFYFNPGSVGVAYDRHQPDPDQPGGVPHLDSWAEYAVLEVTEERTALTFRRVPYPAESIIQAALRSGRPFADRYVQEYS
ncbi:MAG TPA: metallophosphoesterase family protein [Ktedonobacterales bacterium]|nr:metallophosphoesterase family protein [Ktedonobacterales bacterium]